MPGLQRIYFLTRSGGYELRIDMADFDNATAFAHYTEFSVGQDSVNPEEDGYPLIVEGYSGTAGKQTGCFILAERSALHTSACCWLVFQVTHY